MVVALYANPLLGATKTGLNIPVSSCLGFAKYTAEKEEALASPIQKEPGIFG